MCLKGLPVFENVCDVISLGLTVPREDYMGALRTHFVTEIRDLFF